MALSLYIQESLHRKIVSISYHLGGKGKYSRTVRAYIKRGIEKYLQGLNENGRQEFEQILTRVKNGAGEEKAVMISFQADADFRQVLIAIAHHMGAGGAYAVPVRKFLVDEAGEYIRGLEGRPLREFEEILQNVEIRESMK